MSGTLIGPKASHISPDDDLGGWILTQWDEDAAYRYSSLRTRHSSTSAK